MDPVGTSATDDNYFDIQRFQDLLSKLEESKKFTVAPAYNKGAYQVIPKEDIEWIGK